MKKIYKYMVLSIAAVTFSCNDAIEIEQVGRLGAEQAFETVSDLESGILGTYNNFDYTPSIQWESNFTDEIAIGPDNGGQGIGIYQWVVTPQSAASVALWTNYYAALNSANRIIEAAANITPETGEEADYNNVLGEAHALRAWAHFELWSYFTPDYLDANSPSVLLVNFVPGVSDQLSRSTSAEILAQVTSDLDRAAQLLQVTSDPTRVSQDFVTALRARVALYTQDYTTADAAAASLLGSYNLANQAQFTAMWDDADNTEVIFKLERSVGDPYDGQGSTGSAFAGGWAGANYAFVNPTVDGSPYFVASSDLFALMPAGDIRRDVYIDESAAPAYDVLPVGKYPGSGGQPLLNDLKIFRAADMLLIRAEAAVANNNLAAAAGYIDQLRDARYGSDQATPTIANQTAGYALVLQERRVEFAFEGHRYRDLKRLGSRASVGISRPSAECDVYGACTLASTDFRFTLPIPLVELDANPAITEQNPGY
ncbi:RagB/SusD family nutrient uptake outer membrane protein [Ekhidna sp.]|uniref:RagB/SusD family nutrient uptake outer membrane protein n=1 Tax=Ekhidna sp. TaxID=2608089 RepID=UPI003CCBA73C